MAEMKKISVDEIKPGMIFSQAVYIDRERMFVAPNVAVTVDDIKRIRESEVTELETMGIVLNTSESNMGITVATGSSQVIENYEKLLGMRKNMIEVYSNACSLIDKVYSSARKDNLIDFSGVGAVVEDIISLLSENRDVFIFLNGLDDVDRNYLVIHSVNVAFYALMIGQAMGYNEKQLKELGMGSILIDMGMVKVPAYITDKQSVLTDNEYNIVKSHALYGYKLLISYDSINEKIANISLQHHEQFNGKGYPRGLKGKEIDEYARIVSIADSYEAQISKRSYREKIGAYHAMKNLLASGVNKFDPEILNCFFSIMSVYPIGSLVELNDGTIGIVIGSIMEKPLRPIIKLIFDNSGIKIDEINIVNLIEDNLKYITRVIDEKEARVNVFDVLWSF